MIDLPHLTCWIYIGVLLLLDYLLLRKLRKKRDDEEFSIGCLEGCRKLGQLEAFSKMHTVLIRTAGMKPNAACALTAEAQHLLEDDDQRTAPNRVAP